MAVYFTSEEAASEGERKQPPPELQAQMEEMAALSIGELEFLNLSNPGCTRPVDHEADHASGGPLKKFHRGAVHASRRPRCPSMPI